MRKADIGVLVADVRERLQWGRNILVAESIFIFFHTGMVTVLQWGRNILVAESSGAVIRACEVDGTLQWGRNILVAESSRPPAT